MEQKKIKTFKIRLLKTASESTLKKSRTKTIKIVKKIDEDKIIDQSLEKDFLHENGNPLNFLTRDHSENIHSPRWGKFTGRSSVMSKQSVNNSHMSFLSSSGVKKVYKKRCTVLNVAQIVKKEIVESKINRIKKRIEEDKQNTDRKIRTLSSREKLAYFKDEKSLNVFEKYQKTWSKIDLGLTKKSDRDDKDLVSKKNRIFRNLGDKGGADWLMSLRVYGKHDKFEKFIPVGNKLSGLYLREMIHTEDNEDKSKSCNNLKLAGMQVLPLEIDAVKKMGNIKIPISSNEEKFSEETLAENYDYSHKFLKKF